MTTNEVFEKITSKIKWYDGYCNKRVSIYIKHKHKAGKMTLQEYLNMFSHFGYSVVRKTQWTDNL